jgi:mannose-1-phosphate guanylyltransferase
MKAMVLCAGFGTRLRPLTDKVPKPLVPVCGLPLLQYNLALLHGAGVREVVINTHHLGAEMEKGARELAARIGLLIEVSSEKGHILGTGGGVRAAAHLLGNETFFLLNGDMLFDVDLDAALAAHRAHKAVSTMVLAPYPKGATYSSVEIDGEQRVRRIAGRGAPAEAGLTKTHFTGVHVMEPEVIARLPADGEADINRTAYVKLIHEGAVVHGFLQAGYWGDLGAPRSFLRANLDVLDGKVPLGRFSPLADPRAGMVERTPGVFVHPSALIDSQARFEAPALIGPRCMIGPDAQVGPHAILAAGVRVDPGASIVRAACWDGTHLGSGEQVKDEIAAPGVRMDA